MIAEIAINTFLWIIAVTILAYVVIAAVGFALTVYDEIMEVIDERKSRRYWIKKHAAERKDRTDKHIRQLERELGITDTLTTPEENT